MLTALDLQTGLNLLHELMAQAAEVGIPMGGELPNWKGHGVSVGSNRLHAEAADAALHSMLHDLEGQLLWQILVESRIWSCRKTSIMLCC